MLLRLLLAAPLLLVACSTGGDGSEAKNAEDELRPGWIDTVSSIPLPIGEVSGLGQRRVSGKTSFLAIGDASNTLVTFAIDGGEISTVKTHDLVSVVGRATAQWEAVAGDGDGRVFVLGETSGTITVIDRDLRRVVHTMKLVIPSSHSLARDWAADDNSRGEGMVLLSNGHVLVAKEKGPAALIEFGPKDTAAEGYRPDLALGERAFPLPDGATSELVPLKHWVLKDSDVRWLGDISDLAVDDEGRLVLLSDQGRAIARIERELDPTEAKIDVKAIFALPSSVSKAEGLTFAGGRPFVASDGKHEDDALFEIEALP